MTGPSCVYAQIDVIRRVKQILTLPRKKKQPILLYVPYVVAKGGGGGGAWCLWRAKKSQLICHRGCGV